MHGKIDNLGQIKANINIQNQLNAQIKNVENVVSRIENSDQIKATIGIQKQLNTRIEKAERTFSGTVTIADLITDEYTGETVITPSSYFDQELETKGKVVKENITVKQTPYYETTNSTGKTIYIGNEDLIVFEGGN